MARIVIIAAVGKNLELGYNNNLIWHLKEDMKYFKEMTMGHKVIMGYNTYTSLPKLLVGRENIILTSKNIEIDGAQIFNNIDALMEYLDSIDEEVFIIGGAMLYKTFVDKADVLLLTEIGEECEEADVFFPSFKKENYEREVVKKGEENQIGYSFVKYRRVK
ncbi:MAG: dihydrofolate reductase [Bacilli bacterium]|nr:dihydrofolate reductase [Bacilli bacterium]